MKLLLVSMLFVGLAAAQVQESFLVRHKRGADDEGTKNPKTDSDTSCIKDCCDSGSPDKCTAVCTARIDMKSNYDKFFELTNAQLVRSYELLFLSAQFGTHNKDRPGFEKVLHGLANTAWGKGIEMIQESAKRGIEHDFEAGTVQSANFGELSEVQAMSKAFEIEKELLIKANDVHRHHSHAATDTNPHHNYDSGLAHYLEEEIIEGKTDTVRSLVGYINDLKKLFMKGSEIFATSLYLFDQYLQK